jgi:hypothetical protein
MEQQNQYRLFMPMLMLAAAVAVWLGFTTMQLIQDRDDLRVAGENQQLMVEQSQKLRLKAKALGEQLVALGDRGNKTAADIVAQMEKQGIKLTPAATVEPATPEEDQ